MARGIFALVFALTIPIGCKWGTKPTAPPSSAQAPPSGILHFGASSPRSRWSDYEDLGADASGVAKSTTGNLFGCYAINNNAAIRYLDFFDSSTAPAPNAVPRLQFGIPASGGEIIIGSDFWQADGIGFAKGIAWGISTTKGTFTAATPGDHDLMAIIQ